MKMLSVAPWGLEKITIWIIAIGSLTIVNVAPFIFANKLHYDFYFVFFPMMLIFSGLIINILLLYKTIQYDDQILKSTSKKKEVVIPIRNIKGVFCFISLCRISYVENGKPMSLIFIINNPGSFGFGMFSDAMKKFKFVLDNSKN